MTYLKITYAAALTAILAAVCGAMAVQRVSPFWTCTRTLDQITRDGIEYCGSISPW